MCTEQAACDGWQNATLSPASLQPSPAPFPSLASQAESSLGRELNESDAGGLCTGVPLCGNGGRRLLSEENGAGVGSDPSDPLCDGTYSWRSSSRSSGELFRDEGKNPCYGGGVKGGGTGWNETCIRLLCAGSAACTGYTKNDDGTRFWYRGTPTGLEGTFSAGFQCFERCDCLPQPPSLPPPSSPLPSPPPPLSPTVLTVETVVAFGLGERPR